MHDEPRSRRGRQVLDRRENLNKPAGPATLWVMHAAPGQATTSERLSWDEIRRRFPDQWVVLVDADWLDDHNFEFGTAQLFAHRERRSEATADMGAACRQFENVGCFFTGRVRGAIPRFVIP